MRIKYLKEAVVLELRDNVSNAVALYNSDTPLLEAYFKDRTDWLCDSSLTVEALPELDPADNGAAEAANAVALHKSIVGLTPSQAADERLWTWLAHGPYWRYMQGRWPVSGKKDGTPTDYIQNHYFVGRNVRNLVRHGISRLWWFAQTTYDEKRQDPYELTKVMLEFSDNRQSVMERAFSRNREFVQALLDRALYWRGQGKDILSKREQFRSLCKEMNLNGGTMLLDCLARTEVHELFDDFIARNIPA
jgi:hypothetical protein